MNAHDHILWICRAVGVKLRDPRPNTRGKPVWCMRVRPDGQCVIVDNAYFDSPIVAQGDDWDAVREQLREVFAGTGQLPTPEPATTEQRS